MRLAKILTEGEVRVGVVEENHLTAAPAGTPFEDLFDRSGGPLSMIGWEKISLENVEWLPPVRDNALVIGIGLNTKSHFAETTQLMNRTPGDYPEFPRLFIRTMDSFVGHNAAMLMPVVSKLLDYEGEIGVVIGAEGRHVSEADAMSCVGGYTCCDDGSVRDFQMHTNQVTAGKNFVRSGSIGPWVVTSDEIPDPMALTLQTHVNGELRQQLTMDDLIFSIPRLVAYISQIFVLRPGDLVMIGSPAGVGGVTGQWLVPGDDVKITVPAIGTLANAIAAA